MPKIEMGKKYKLKGSGVKVNIVSVTMKYPDYPVLIEDPLTGALSRYTLDGVPVSSFDRELVECLPYEDFKVDDLVLVWDLMIDNKRKRYFAGVNSSGMPTTFNGGATSWSTDGGKTSWRNCEKA